VHEAWLKLIDQNPSAVKNRGHFMALAAQAMRRIVIDHARGKKRQKRGGAWARLSLDEAMAVQDEGGLDDVLAIDEALERLREKSEPMARIVELRFYGGLGLEEVAEALGRTEGEVARDWRAARAMIGTVRLGIFTTYCVT